MLIDGIKYACKRCIRGHRVSGCTHTDEQLIVIKRKGRPANTQSRNKRRPRTTRSRRSSALADDLVAKAVISSKDKVRAMSCSTDASPHSLLAGKAESPEPYGALVNSPTSIGDGLHVPSAAPQSASNSPTLVSPVDSELDFDHWASLSRVSSSSSSQSGNSPFTDSEPVSPAVVQIASQFSPYNLRLSHYPQLNSEGLGHTEELPLPQEAEDFSYNFLSSLTEIETLQNCYNNILSPEVLSVDSAKPAAFSGAGTPLLVKAAYPGTPLAYSDNDIRAGFYEHINSAPAAKLESEAHLLRGYTLFNRLY